MGAFEPRVERLAADPVEEELQQAGVGGLVGRAGEHDQVASLDLGHQVGHLRIGPVEHGGTEFGEVHAEIRGPSGQLLGYRARCLVGAGTWLGIADDDGNVHWGSITQGRDWVSVRPAWPARVRSSSTAVTACPPGCRIYAAMLAR